MSVGTISLVGISIVFLSFVVLYIIFRLLEVIFGDKKTKTTLKQVPETRSQVVSNEALSVTETMSDEENTELIAVISAAVAAIGDKPCRILNISETKETKSNWKNHKSKIWRPVRKGVRKSW